MINVQSVSKRFKLYRRPSDRLVESLLRRPRHKTHHALRELSFSVAAGETLGIIGRNGAGKSTLLKILMGVLIPDAGEVRIDGRVTGLLELGTGFDPALSGLQNIERNAVMLGLSRREIAERRPRIIAFSELGGYIDEPLRTYSSGMVMRLAFSIAIHADPKCFIVDEALAVGDAHFQQKCMRRIQVFRREGGSLVFVSHDLNSVKLLCDRVIVLDAGRIAYAGTPDAAVNRYNRLIADLDDEGMPSAETSRGCYGTRTVEILSGTLLGQDGLPTQVVAAGEPVRLRFRLHAREAVDDCTFGILLRDRFGQDIFGTNTHFMQHPLRLAAGQTLELEMAMAMNLGPGKYTLTSALHSGEHHLEDCYHWCDNLIRFEIAGVLGTVFYGIARLEPKIAAAREIDAGGRTAVAGEDR